MKRHGCPATGRMNHAFDKSTHRCKCGRWERGFKPTSEPVLPRAECQVCERHQALEAGGVLTHHGYRRPGDGSILGDCAGVGHAPYPATDALESYLASLQRHLEALRGQLADLPRCHEFAYHLDAGRRRNKETVTLTVRRGEAQRYDAATARIVPGFDELMRQNEYRLRQELARTEAEEKRVERRITAAKEPK